MNILITGITGTLGKRVAKRCIENGHAVYGVSRDEFKIKNHPYYNSIIWQLGDIRDKEFLNTINKNFNIIFHFAALKHVDVCELSIDECIKTNVNGTRNIYELSQRLKSKLVFTSTDKAVQPINVYGCSKQIGEKIVLQESMNAVCRYGNVLNSNGSVFKLFQKQILENKEVLITDKDMTRFFITIEDAANFVYQCGMYHTGMQIPYSCMKTSSIVHLANAVIHVMHNIGDIDKSEVKYKFIGTRPGEKIHECLEYNDHENQIVTSKNYSESYSFEEMCEMAKVELKRE